MVSRRVIHFIALSTLVRECFATNRCTNMTLWFNDPSIAYCESVESAVAYVNDTDLSDLYEELDIFKKCLNETNVTYPGDDAVFYAASVSQPKLATGDDASECNDFVSNIRSDMHASCVYAVLSVNRVFSDCSPAECTKADDKAMCSRLAPFVSVMKPCGYYSADEVNYTFVDGTCHMWLWESTSSAFCARGAGAFSVAVAALAVAVQ